MRISKEIENTGLVTFRTYRLKWVDLGDFYSVTILWYGIEDPDGLVAYTTVLFTPKDGSASKAVKVASLKDGFALVKVLGGDVNVR